MQLGYPNRVSIDSLNGTYERYISCGVFESGFNGIKQFYTKLLLSIGFKSKDFKFGETLIFFRGQNSGLIDQLLGSPPNSIELNVTKMRHYTARIRFRSVVYALIFLRGF